MMTASDETSLSICYCSVLEDCWILDAPGGGDATTTPVAHCPTYATKFVARGPRRWRRRSLRSILHGGTAAGSGDASAKETRDAR